MCRLYKNIFLGAVVLSIAACGSDSTVGEDPVRSTPEPSSAPTAIPTATPPPTPPPTDAQESSVSGTISVAANLLPDSDNNDPNSQQNDNSTAELAQTINNRSSIQGFLTKEGTGNSSDQLSSTPDESDYYAVTLQAGQVVQMQVINYDQFHVDSVLSGDLDLALYNADNEVIVISEEIGEFEQVQAPEDGLYYVRAYAFSGSSKYVIRIIDQGSSQLSRYQKSLDFIPGQAVIKTKTQPSFSAKSTNSLPQNAQLSHSQNTRPALLSWQVEDIKQSSLGPQFALSKKAKVSEQKLATLIEIKKMRLQEGTEYAEPNYILQPQRVPNDRYYDFQWHYPAMNLPQAWDITTGEPTSGDIIVAVVDTGVFLNHSEIDEKLVAGYDFISSPTRSNDGDGIDNNPDDPGDSNTPGASSWHGTHVAGTIAAETDNRSGVAGVSWGAKIMPLRALGIDGGTSYDILQAVRFAAGLENDSGTVPAQAADIINLSLGGDSFSSAEEQLYKQISDSGIIIVAAAGNANTSDLLYPASYDGVISVAAVDARNRRAPYSNFGTEIDIAAPGGNTSADVDGDGRQDGILSLVADDSSGSREPVLNFYQGTSMAAPHVAGMFALMKAVYPELSSQEALAALQSGALTTDAGETGRDNTFGYGLADALKAVQEAQRLAAGGAPSEPPASFIATPSILNLGSDESATLTISNRGGGDPSVTSFESNADWLSISADDTDDKGIGSYLLTVDRSNLVNGIFTATVTFTFDDAPSLLVRISMLTGELVTTSGQLSQLYVLLIDPEATDGDNVIAQAQTSNNADGSVFYEFEDVPPGSYLIVAGTDIDNDGIICQAGEGCGSYPSLNESEQVTTDGETPLSVDFVADILAGFTNISSLASEEEGAQEASQPSFHRLDVQQSSDTKRLQTP